MNPARIARLERELADMEAERAHRIANDRALPVWFDHVLEQRRRQLDANRAAAPQATRAPGLLQRIIRKVLA